MLMSKSKKTLETSLDFTSSFKTSVDSRVKGLASNGDYLYISASQFSSKEIREKKKSAEHIRLVL